MQTRATDMIGWEEDSRGVFEPDRVATVGDGFERGAALDSLCICVRTHELRSGRITAVCSGVTLDLRQAALSPEGATLYVQSALSGIDILVPPDWDVACDVDAIYGRVGEWRSQVASAGRRPQLRITGTLVAGGISVR